VIHGHWIPFGSLTAVEITKTADTATFDLNYFVLTSNTQNGGGPATGLEKAYVEGFSDAAGTISTGPKVKLPSEDWGFPATQVFLGPAFDAVRLVRFTVDNTTDPVFCFGMDEFFIDEPAPTNGVPEATSFLVWALLGGSSMGFVGTLAAARPKLLVFVA
jgi:hypothetical protein